MADSRSASLFGELIQFAAEKPTTSREEFLAKLWELQRGLDFHPCELECDDILAEHGYLREGTEIDRWTGELEQIYGPAK